MASLARPGHTARIPTGRPLARLHGVARSARPHRSHPHRQTARSAAWRRSLGQARPSYVRTVNMEFSEDQEALRSSVRRFLEDRAPIAHVRAVWDDATGTTDAVWQGLTDLGVLGLLVPEAH